MKITDVRVKVLEKNSENRLRGVASITIDDVFVVHDIRLIDGENGIFVAMPSKKLSNGEFKDIAHPINQETRHIIENMVLEAYNKEVQI